MKPVERTATPMARLSLVVAVLSILMQSWPHTRDIMRDTYKPGAAFEPRVKAILDVSRVAASGGPYLAVPSSSGFEPVDRKVNDLGFSAFAYAWASTTGRPLRRRHLMALNLCILLAAVLGLLTFAPTPQRLVAALILLLIPLPPADFRSPDPLSTHGSLALLGVVVASAVARSWARPLWVLPAAALFALYAIRSAYAYYAAAALLAVTVVESVRLRNGEPILRGAFILISTLLMLWPWQASIAARGSDSRVLRQDTLGTHPIFIPLLEGVGWSENRWGLKPYDPWIATYLANRFGLEPLDVGAVESERRARITYVDLWREAPGHLVMVYASRVPGVAREHAAGGLAGALALLIALPLALVTAWGRAGVTLGLLVAAASLTACLVFQAVVLDPREAYTYPLRVASGLTLAFALSVLAERAFVRPT